MLDYRIWSHVLMELALSVGGEREEMRLMEKAASAFLHKLDCTSVWIIKEQTNGMIVPLVVMPQRLKRQEMNPVLRGKIASSILVKHQPMHFSHEGEDYYLFRMQDCGWILFGRGEPFPEGLPYELIPIIDTLALNCLSSKAFSTQEQVERVLARRLDFQKLLMQLATGFVNVRMEQMDEAIDNILGIAGMYTGVDRAYLFSYDFDAGLMHNTHEWCSVNTTPSIGLLQDVPCEPFLVGWVDAHLAGEIVHVPEVKALPKDSALYGILSEQDIQTLVTIPLMLGSQCIGFIGFDAVSEQKTWEEDELALLQVMAELFTNAELRRGYEKDLIVARKNAESANQAKSEFLANMSHEIRTPLNGITGSLHLMEDTILSQEQMEYLLMADASAESLLTIINNILDLSKIDAGLLKLSQDIFSLEEEVYLVLGMMTGKAREKKLELIVDYQTGTPIHFVGDQMRIRQILLNLVGNAVKFTDIGSVMICVTAKVNAEKEIAEVKIEVCDTGVGISQEHIGEIFNPFVQEDASPSKRFEGTGLGLAISKQLVDLMAGTLTAESHVGEGSTFIVCLTLPLAEKPSSDLEIGVEGLRVLIVTTTRSTDESFQGIWKTCTCGIRKQKVDMKQSVFWIRV